MEILRKMKKCAEKSGGCECRYCSLHVPCQKMKEAIDLAVAALIYKDAKVHSMFEGDDGK